MCVCVCIHTGVYIVKRLEFSELKISLIWKSFQDYLSHPYVPTSHHSHTWFRVNFLATGLRQTPTAENIQTDNQILQRWFTLHEHWINNTSVPCYTRICCSTVWQHCYFHYYLTSQHILCARCCSQDFMYVKSFIPLSKPNEVGIIIILIL